MVAIGYSALKRSSALGLLTFALAGCTSVEYSPQHQLAAKQTIAPKAQAAVATQNLSGTAKADTTEAMPTAVAVKGSRVAQPGKTVMALAPNDANAQQSDAESMSAAFAEMPLTDEVTAIQSAIPMKRPDSPFVADRQPEMSSQLAYAATPTPSRALTSMNSMVDFDTRSAKDIEDRMAAHPEETPKSKGGPAVDNQILKKLISKYASLYHVPEALVHRVVKRESTYNPKAYSKGNYGLMQIRYNTAKAMGYDGPASGLFDAETNLKYAVKYLRGAWLTADNDHDGAVRLYASGYYYTAKRKGLLNQVQ